ncbi:MAG: carbohydrate ABC transporter permease [Oscillospiraceae bacterium]|nr:carbohydrate ABC transporter permease [Oscillospiraceae bacterium]
MRATRKAASVICYLVFAALAAAYILPLVITLTNSFMGQSELAHNLFGYVIRMPLLPSDVTLAQYRQILIESPIYLNMLWNTIAIATPVILGTLIVSSAAAYAFTVLTFKGKETLFFIYLVVMLLPLQVTLMPNYIVADFLGIRDSWLAIILPGIFSPFGVFILRRQMKVMPVSYIEAAQIDGAGHLRILSRIVLPLVKSGLAALAVLTFIEYWNLIDQAIVFIEDIDKQPMSLFLSRINQKQMGVTFAASSFYVFPALVVLLYGADYLRDGIRLSSNKT